MHRTSPLDCLSALPQPEDLSHFRKEIDPSWVEEALRSTGTATIRKRRLPATQVIWLVIGMALFRNRSITEVASSLALALPTPDGAPTAARSAVSKLGVGWVKSHLRGCSLALQTSGHVPVRTGIAGGILRCTPSTD